MGAFDWSPTTRHSNIISQITFFCEWEMSFHHSIQIQHHKEKTEEESGLEPEQEEEGGENSPSSSKAQCEWDFHLSTVVSSNSIGAISDTLGVIEFDPSNQFLATAGIARKIRIYSLNSLLHQGITQSAAGTQQQQTSLLDHNTVCDFYICTPAKLSSVRWKPDTAGCVVGSGDYDGVVTEYDLERRVPIFERDEHGGRRVWSVDYSHWNRVIGASGSDDGTTQLWDTRCGTDQYISVIQPSVGRSPVCCVEFDPLGGNLIAVGCADRNAYTYDVRNMLNPVSVFAGHQKTVSYVRFLGEGMMVSAGTDGCLKLWDMDSGHVIRTYKGHVNSRNFVGLSVWSNGGLIGCGSESNEVFVYDKRWSEPIWVRGLEPIFGTNSDQNRFISSVCWKQVGEEDQCTLVAGGSDGILQVFVGKRKSSSS